MKIDENKVQKKIQELGGPVSSHRANWIAVDGLHALTSVEFKDSNVNFLPASGIPVKVFINVQNGEIKMFPASVFAESSN